MVVSKDSPLSSAHGTADYVNSPYPFFDEKLKKMCRKLEKCGRKTKKRENNLTGNRKKPGLLHNNIRRNTNPKER